MSKNIENKIEKVSEDTPTLDNLQIILDEINSCEEPHAVLNAFLTFKPFFNHRNNGT